MDNRPLPLLAAAGLVTMLALGGCAGARPDGPADPAPAAATLADPTPATAAGAADPTRAHAAQTPCTARLRPGGAGTAGTPMALTPQVRAEIERLRRLPPEQQAAEAEASRARDPELTARLQGASEQVTRAARPCVDR